MSKEKKAQVMALLNWLSARRMCNKCIGDLRVSDLAEIVEVVTENGPWIKRLTK